MIKKFNLMLSVTILLLVSSCGKEFLEVAPKGSLIASKTSEYENMMYSSLALGIDIPSVPLGDDAAMLDSYFESGGLRLQRLFRWEADIYEPMENAAELQSPINSIYIYNKIINEVMDSKEGSQEYKIRILAEAKATRAYANMMLANYYSKPYEAASAATDLSIPLIKQADVSETSFSRATVKEVYDSMISDLKESIPLIPVNQPHRLRMTKAAAEFTLAKIYWYTGAWESALSLITSGKSHLPTSFANQIYDYNQTYLVPTWSVPSGNNNNESLLARTSLSDWASSSNAVLLAPWVYELYTPTDKRLNSFSKVPYFGTGTFPAGLARRKGPFGNQVHQGVSLPDVELMKAECEARLDKISDAQKTLSDFRLKRMDLSEATVSISDKNQLIRFIVDERTREFALYGFRWYDMRRLSKDSLFKDKVYTHVKYSAQTEQALDTYTLKTDRLTLRFPTTVITANPQMPNNP